MSNEFNDLLIRLRAGDEAAVHQLVRDYQPIVTLAIRGRIKRTRLRASLDTADVFQSAIISLLRRLAEGQFDLQSAADLEKLLLTVARRKLSSRARYEFAERRNRMRTEYLPANSRLESPKSPSAESNLIRDDLLDRVLSKLSSEEVILFRRRRAGQSWQSIATDLGADPVVLRQRLSRALRRAATELGLN